MELGALPHSRPSSVSRIVVFVKLRPLKTGASIAKLKKEAGLLKFAWRHPRMPWYAKAGLALSILYLVSPVDVVPDAIPLAGLLDDVILVPLGLSAIQKMIPANVREDYDAHLKNEKRRKNLPWLLLTIAVVIGAMVVVQVVGGRS